MTTPIHNSPQPNVQLNSNSTQELEADLDAILDEALQEMGIQGQNSSTPIQSLPIPDHSHQLQEEEVFSNQLLSFYEKIAKNPTFARLMFSNLKMLDMSMSSDRQVSECPSGIILPIQVGNEINFFKLFEEKLDEEDRAQLAKWGQEFKTAMESTSPLTPSSKAINDSIVSFIQRLIEQKKVEEIHDQNFLPQDKEKQENEISENEISERCKFLLTHCITNNPTLAGTMARHQDYDFICFKTQAEFAYNKNNVIALMKLDPIPSEKGSTQEMAILKQYLSKSQWDEYISILKTNLSSLCPVL